MTKDQAMNVVQGLSEDMITDIILSATVYGQNGVNQTGSTGYQLSAVAAAYNIVGNVGNPNGRTKITNRYKNYNVTGDMIYEVVHRYPNGIPSSSPLFDELLGVSGTAPVSQNSFGNTNSWGQGGYQGGGYQGGENVAANLSGVIVLVVAFIIFKAFLHWGWIASIIMAIIAGSLVDSAINKK